MNTDRARVIQFYYAIACRDILWVAKPKQYNIINNNFFYCLVHTTHVELRPPARDENQKFLRLNIVLVFIRRRGILYNNSICAIVNRCHIRIAGSGCVMQI